MRGVISFAFLLLISVSTRAHYPTMECSKKETNIICELGFSDGSKVKGAEVRLISYEEEVLDIAKADAFSRVSFDEPGEEFYIYFDAKHEFPIEVDYGELRK
jgi:hypothetical protein